MGGKTKALEMPTFKDQETDEEGEGKGVVGPEEDVIRLVTPGLEPQIRILIYLVSVVSIK